MLDNMQNILSAVAAGTLTPDEADERISALDAQAQAWEVVDEGIPTSNTQSNRAEPAQSQVREQRNSANLRLKACENIHELIQHFSKRR